MIAPVMSWNRRLLALVVARRNRHARAVQGRRKPHGRPGAAACLVLDDGDILLRRLREAGL